MQKKQFNTNAGRVIIHERYLLQTIYYKGQKSIIYDAIDLKNQYQNIVVQIAKDEQFNKWKYQVKLQESIKYTISKQIQWLKYTTLGLSKQIQSGGPSLLSCFKLMRNKFTIQTIALIGIKMISILQILHSNNVIHRRLKLSSILTTLNSELLLANFEQSKKFRDDGQHKINYKSKVQNANLNKFSSLGMHLNQNPCPKDDLESLLYIVIYLLTNGQHICSKNSNVRKSDKLKYFMDVKSKMIAEKILKPYPEQFVLFYYLIKNLNTQGKPNYDMIKQPLLQVIGQNEFRCQFDWIPIIIQRRASTPQNKRSATHSARELDIELIGSVSEEESQKSAPASPTRKQMSPVTSPSKFRLSHFLKKTDQQHMMPMMPPILEKGESQQTQMPSSRKISSSSGNLSSDVELAIQELPQFEAFMDSYDLL